MLIEGDPHKFIPAEIAKDLHLTQTKLLAAVKSNYSKGKFLDPMMIRRCCLVPKFLLEFFELVGNTAIDLPIDLQSELLKALQTSSHDKSHDHYNLGYSNKLQQPYLANYNLFGTRE